MNTAKILEVKKLKDELQLQHHALTYSEVAQNSNVLKGTAERKNRLRLQRGIRHIKYNVQELTN